MPVVRRGGGSADETDTLNTVGSIQSVQIESGVGLCLDVHAPCQKENGCKVQVWECGGEQQQQWTIDKGEIRNGALNTEY